MENVDHKAKVGRGVLHLQLSQNFILHQLKVFSKVHDTPKKDI